MGKISYPALEIKKSLRKAEAEVMKLKELTQDMPGIQKNIIPIQSFLDILKFHLDDLT